MKDIAMRAWNARGFMAEIMAKNFTNAELDQPFDEWEIEALMRSLRRMGDLDEDMIYRGSTRGGYSHGGFLVSTQTSS